MIYIKLWELLFAGFFIPAFWFGWQWAYRVGVIAIALKAAQGMIGKATSKLRGEDSHG